MHHHLCCRRWIGFGFDATLSGGGSIVILLLLFGIRSTIGIADVTISIPNAAQHAHTGIIPKLHIERHDRHAQKQRKGVGEQIAIAPGGRLNVQTRLLGPAK